MKIKGFFVILVLVVIIAFFVYFIGSGEKKIIENEKLVRIDNPLEKAKRGGKYYPHKDIMIEELIKLHNENNSR